MLPEFLSQCPEASLQTSRAVKEEFTNTATGSHYDSLNVLLDFCDFLKKNSSEPTQSWTPLLSSYHPSPRSIFARSGGGTSILLALLAQELCARHGITSLIIPEERPLHSSLFFPKPHPLSPSHGYIWKEAYTLLGGVTHLMCLYRDQSSFTTLQQYYTGGPSVYEFPTYQDFLHRLHEFSVQQVNPIHHAEALLKKSLQTSLTYHVIHPTKPCTLTLNLLDGMLTVNPSPFPELPRNSNGMAGFSIIALFENPDVSTEVIINDKPAILNNSELLRRYLDGIQSTFHFAPPFQAALFFLMSYRKKFFDEILCPPASCLLALWKLYTEVDELRRKFMFVQQRSPFDGNQEAAKQFAQAESSFSNAERLMHSNREEASQSAFLDAKAGYIACLNACSNNNHTPLDILLIDFVG